MTRIKIYKKSNGYQYEYFITNEENKNVRITRSGFKTPEDALEEAKRSYDRRVKKTIPHPKHIEKVKHKKEVKKEKKPFKIKNLNITDEGCIIMGTAVVGIVLVTAVYGFTQLAKDFREKFPDKNQEQIIDYLLNGKETINQSDCDFENVYIILRTAEDETNGVGAVTSDMLTRLGVSNEVISANSNLTEKVSTAISENPNSNIVVINLESGLENTYTNNTVIMGDCSNKRVYSSDTLAACINTSLKEYNLSPVIRSGQKTSGGWRLPSYIEEDLTNATLINNVSQLTIDLPLAVGEDEIIRNDAAASIVEGIMRWSSIDINERYREIYYTAAYGDTIVSVGKEYGVSSVFIENNSDLDLHKQVAVGDTLTIGYLPNAALDTVVVNNPYTTTDINSIEPVIVTYVVQSGDTLTKIANAYGVKIEDIAVPSGDPNTLQIGDILYITTYNYYETHEKIDLLAPIEEPEEEKSI